MSNMVFLQSSAQLHGLKGAKQSFAVPGAGETALCRRARAAPQAPAAGLDLRPHKHQIMHMAAGLVTTISHVQTMKDDA